MKLLLICAFSYLLGAVPFALVFSSLFTNKDVRQSGTRNIGATNALLVSGPVVGVFTLICDITKGVIPVLVARLWLGTDLAIVLAALFAVLGHDFSVFLKFKGGKGVSTTGGAMLAIDPLLTLFLILLWFLMLIVIRHFIPSSVTTICFIPLFMWFSVKTWPYVLLGLVFALLALWQHRQDLERFFRGKEERIDRAVVKYLGK